MVARARGRRRKLVRIRALLFALLLPMVSEAVAQQDGPTVIPIALSEFKFTPSSLNLKAHSAYVLRLTNIGARAHDLSAPGFFAAVTLSAATAAKIHDGRVALRAGETTDLDLTTGDAAAFPFDCHYPFHALLGMKGN